MVVRSSSDRRERARAHVRQDILAAAAAVFAEKGYAGATLADLAEAAGFAAPSLYRYFESKEEIFRSLLQRFVDGLEATFQAPVDRQRPVGERLEVLLRLQARHSAENARLLPILSTPIADVVVEIAGHRLGDPAAGMAFYRERLLAWLERNTAPEELRLPPALVATAFAGVAFAFHLLHRQEGAEAEANVPLLVDLAVHGFAPAPAPPGPRALEE